uniref:Holin n=1 Tax=viral metagenome TaxID=1070528 RepID=A0A6M3XVQ4_9ZZZZ
MEPQEATWKKFVSKKFVGYLLALAVLVLVAVFGKEISETTMQWIVIGTLAAYATLCGSDVINTGGVLKTTRMIEDIKAKAAVMMNGQVPPGPGAGG